MTEREEYIAALDSIPALGGRNYSDVAPDNTDPPYTVTRFDISETPALRGDARTLATRRLSQTDLWETRSGEDEDLRTALWNTLDGLRFSTGFRLAARSVTRVPDTNFDLVHRAFTFAFAKRILRRFDIRSLTVTAPANEQALHITWPVTTGHVATKLRLRLFLRVSGVGVQVGETVVPSPGTLVQPYAAPVGQTGTYYVEASPGDGGGFGAPFVSDDVDVIEPATLQATVTAVAAPAVRLVGQGFLLGLTDDAGTLLLPTYLSGLRAKQWRLDNAPQLVYARAHGYNSTCIISDIWFQSTRDPDTNTAPAPWANWGVWESFVADVVTTAAADGWTPDYWDIWNEPQGGFLNDLGQATMTKALFLELFDRAWHAIKTVDPSAKIVGPSIAGPIWTDTGTSIEFGSFPMNEFLDYSDAHGLVWDAVSWHENQTQHDGDMYPLPANIDRHLANFEAVVSAHPTSVPGAVMFVNEYLPPDWYRLAGPTVCYLRALEESAVAQANRSIWGDYDVGVGVLTSFGGFAPTWFVHRLYADMDAKQRMTVTSHPSWQFSGLAVRDNAASTVRVLLGRHWTSAGNEFADPPVIGPPAKNGSITIAWPYGGSSAHIVVSRIPAQESPISAPTVVSDATVAVVAGNLTVALPSIVDGDALSIIASP